jgi:hypothetical protein
VVSVLIWQIQGIGDDPLSAPPLLAGAAPHLTPHTMISPTRYTPSSTHLYGLYDPDGDGITFYKSAAERDEAAEETIRSYLSDGEWCDDVTNVFAFVVTHSATEVDVVRPVGEIDEDGCDEAGEDWSNTNCDYKCNYALKPFPTPEATNDVINPPVLATHSTPQPPADGEVAELVEWVGKDRQWLDLRRDVKDRILRIADLLQRQHLQPVAVSERLPGAEDCALWPGDPEATPWCWAGKDIDGGWEWAQISMLGLGTDTLSRIIAGGGWTHWLPANALPTPTPEATNV